MDVNTKENGVSPSTLDVFDDAGAVVVDISSSSIARDILAATPNLVQVQKFAAALEKSIESPENLRLLFIALGPSATADIVLASVEPSTYDCKNIKDVDLDRMLADCIGVVARGLRVLGVKDMVLLVARWAQAEHFNPFLACEIFAKADSALATAFASAAINRCLESTKNVSVARALAASASHVLSLVKGVDLFAIFVSLLNSSSKYDAFVSLALAGEAEFPSLNDMARNPATTESAMAHGEFGRVQQLLALAKTCIQNRFKELPLDLLNGLELVEEYERELGDVASSDERIIALETEIEQRIDFVTCEHKPSQYKMFLLSFHFLS